MYRSNQLLVEISNKSHAENLLRTTLFHNLKVRVLPHTSLNSSKGVIRCSDLRNSSEEEILEGTRSQVVTAIKRFKIKRNGQLKDTNIFGFTFYTPALPKTVKVAYFRVSVEIYIPNPLRCHNCQKYGHHENRCTKDPLCANCGEPANHTEQSCRNESVNCGKTVLTGLAQRKRNFNCKIHKKYLISRPLGIKLSALSRPWGLNSHWERC